MLYFVIISLFVLMILLHEAGHMISANMCGIKTKEFSIGMGPRLYSRTIKGTKYSLKLFPIGGSCDISMEEISALPLHKQAAILLSGCLVNIIMGIILSSSALILNSGISGLYKLPHTIISLIKLPFISLSEVKSISCYDLAGPVRAVNLMHDVSKSQASPYVAALLIMAFMCFMVAEFNLLPLPPLDGGEFLCLAIQKIRKGNGKVKKYVTLIIWGTLIWATCMAFFNDAVFVFGKII